MEGECKKPSISVFQKPSILQHQKTNSPPMVPPHTQPPIDSSTPTDTDLSPNSSTKIPIRPQKIRKLSSSDSSQALTLIPPTTITTPKPKRRNPGQFRKDLVTVIKPLSSHDEIASALRHLRSVDPLIATLIDTHPPPTFDSHHPPFLALTKSILYQQLAFKAGASIYSRFVSLCGSEMSVRPETILALSHQELKQIGVSARKASYLYDLSNKYKNGILSDESVVKMDDRSLSTMLSMVKGIGSWSVHMFMIFSLHRPDVLPVSDLGVRKGVQLLYGLEELPRPSQMERLCEKWRPYRSVGAWYMWRFVEGRGPPAAVGMEGGANVQPLQQIQQQQHQLQLLEPINGIGNLGACIWGQ